MIYDRLPVLANHTVMFINVIFEHELEKIKTGCYDINCGLPENEELSCRKEFDRIYNKFKDQGVSY